MNSDFPTRVSSFRRRPVILCLAIFVCCFVLAFLFFLPLDQLARQVEQQVGLQGLELRINDPQLRFPLGFGAEQLQLSHPQLDHPPFLFNTVNLQPDWLSLISNKPKLGFYLEAYQGQVKGSASADGSIQATFSQLQFQEPLAPQLPLVLEGTLVSGEFSGVLPLAGKNRSNLSLQINELRLTGMSKLGSSSDLLLLGTLLCTVEANGSVVQINRLSSTGPGFDLTGTGSLRVGRTAATSKLNLRLVLTPKSVFDPTLKDMLSLLKKPQPDGSYQLNVSGALPNLRVN